MANEIQAYIGTGKTIYAILLNTAGQVWNGAAFVAIAALDWDDYDIPMTEDEAGIYYANMPAASAGVYSYVVYEKAGANPATTDGKLGVGSMQWDGTAVLPLSSIDADLAIVDANVDAILVDTGTDIPAAIATAQADLDNPDQYKADVSALALEATLDEIKGAGFTGADLMTIKAVIDEILDNTEPIEPMDLTGV